MSARAGAAQVRVRSRVGSAAAQPQQRATRASSSDTPPRSTHTNTPTTKVKTEATEVEVEVVEEDEEEEESVGECVDDDRESSVVGSVVSSSGASDSPGGETSGDESEDGDYISPGQIDRTPKRGRSRKTTAPAAEEEVESDSSSAAAGSSESPPMSSPEEEDEEEGESSDEEMRPVRRRPAKRPIVSPQRSQESTRSTRATTAAASSASLHAHQRTPPKASTPPRTTHAMKRRVLAKPSHTSDEDDQADGEDRPLVRVQSQKATSSAAAASTAPIAADSIDTDEDAPVFSNKRKSSSTTAVASTRTKKAKRTPAREASQATADEEPEEASEQPDQVESASHGERDQPPAAAADVSLDDMSDSDDEPITTELPLSAAAPLPEEDEPDAEAAAAALAADDGDIRLARRRRAASVNIAERAASRARSATPAPQEIDIHTVAEELPRLLSSHTNSDQNLALDRIRVIFDQLTAASSGVVSEEMMLICVWCFQTLIPRIAARALTEDVAKRAIRLMQEKSPLLEMHRQVTQVMTMVDLQHPDALSDHPEYASLMETARSVRTPCQPTLLLTLLLTRIGHLLSLDLLDSNLPELNDGRPATSAEFQQFIVEQLCIGEDGWCDETAAQLLIMTFDLNLTSAQQQQVIQFVCDMCVPTLDIARLAAFSQPLLVTSAHGHRELILRAITHRVHALDEEIARQRLDLPHNDTLSMVASGIGEDPADDLRRQFDSMVMTTLLQWEAAVKLDQPLCAQLIKEIQEGHIEVDLFVTGMLMQVIDNGQWRKPVCDLLMPYFQRCFADDAASSRQSMWVALVTSEARKRAGRSESEVPIDEMVHRLIRATRDGQNLQLMRGIMNIGFTLIDAGSQPTGNVDLASEMIIGSTSVPSSTTRFVACAQRIFVELLSLHPEVGGDLVSGLLSRIENCRVNAAGIPAIGILSALISDPHTRDAAGEHTQQMMSSLEWFSGFPVAAGMAFMRALSPLLRGDIALRDFVVRTVHKLAFASSVSARLLAVDAYFHLCECPFQPQHAYLRRTRSSMPQSSPMPQSSQASQSAASSADIDLEFFFRCKDMFRRALTHQFEVRERVYRGLARLFESYENVRPFIFDLLHAHFQRYCTSKADQQRAALTIGASHNLLQLDRALDTTEHPACIAEPLPLLIATIQRMLLVHMRTCDLPELEPGASDFSSSALASMLPDERSAALLRLQMDRLLESILKVGSLHELGIHAPTLHRATMDQPEGVQAVLRAEVMHGVMLTFLEWQVETHVDDAHEDLPLTSTALPNFDASGCRDFLALFDRFWQLHQLLTEEAPKEAAAANKKKARKKKKDDEDDEDEEDDEEEEEDDDDDDDMDDGEERKTFSKKKSSGSSRAKPKSAAKAVSFLCHGRNKLHLSVMSASAVQKLLRLSVPNTGEVMAESEEPHRGGVGRLQLVTHGGSTAGSQASHGDGHHVGDALASHPHLSRFLMMSTRDFVETLLESCRSTGEWLAAVARMRPVAEVVIAQGKRSLQRMKASSGPERDQADEKKKKKKDKRESDVAIFQSVVLALLRICDHIGRESIFTGTLLSMLAPEKHTKVMSGGVASWPKLLHWLCAHFETMLLFYLAQDQRDELDEARRTYHYPEAKGALDILILLYQQIGRFDLGPVGENMKNRRLDFMKSLCPLDCFDGPVASLVLTVAHLTIDSPDNPDAVTRTVGLALHRMNFRTEGNDATEMQLGCINEHTERKCTDWLMQHMTQSIKEIEIVVKEARKRGGHAAGRGKHTATQVAAPKETISKCSKRLTEVLLRLVDLLPMVLVGAQRESLMRLLHRFMKAITAEARMVASFRSPPPKAFRFLVRSFYSHLRPQFDAFLTAYEKDGGSSASTQSKASAKVKKERIKRASNRQANMIVMSVRLLEGLDASIGGVDRTCKVDLSEFIPVDSKARGYRLKDSTAKSERSVSTTMSKASPAPRALSQRSLSQTRSHSHTFRSPANSPLRRNETRLHPRTPVRNSSVVAHEEQPSAMEIDDVDEDQPLLKDEIED